MQKTLNGCLKKNKPIKKSNFNYIILENTKTLSFETAFEYLKLFNKDLKHIIKNKSKIYKDILKTLF